MSRLKIYMNMGTLDDLPESTSLPKLKGEELLAYLKEQGFEGVQGGDPELCRELGMGCAGGGRVNEVSDAMKMAQFGVESGFEHTTLHVGTGLESDEEVDTLVRAVIEAVEKTGHPMSIETHRATVTQDIRRLVDMVVRNPDVQINGDFSHLYTGLEMVYGDFDAKLDFLQPVFDRVRFMHGRIGSPGCMQIDIGDGTSPCPQQTGERDFIADFRKMWTRAMAGFLKTAPADQDLVFAPEILPPNIYYGRSFLNAQGQPVEECDRYQQSLIYARIARECFQSL